MIWRSPAAARAVAAAVQAREEGVEEDHSPRAELPSGRILPQCIHDGFGLEEFGRTMTGPEYALEWIKEWKRRNRISYGYRSFRCGGGFPPGDAAGEIFPETAPADIV